MQLMISEMDDDFLASNHTMEPRPRPPAPYPHPGPTQSAANIRRNVNGKKNESGLAFQARTVTEINQTTRGLTPRHLRVHFKDLTECGSTSARARSSSSPKKISQQGNRSQKQSRNQGLSTSNEVLKVRQSLPTVRLQQDFLSRERTEALAERARSKERFEVSEFDEQRHAVFMEQNIEQEFASENSTAGALLHGPSLNAAERERHALRELNRLKLDTSLIPLPLQAQAEVLRALNVPKRLHKYKSLPSLDVEVKTKQRLVPKPSISSAKGSLETYDKLLNYGQRHDALAQITTLHPLKSVENTLGRQHANLDWVISELINQHSYY